MTILLTKYLIAVAVIALVMLLQRKHPKRGTLSNPEIKVYSVRTAPFSSSGSFGRFGPLSASPDRA